MVTHSHSRSLKISRYSSKNLRLNNRSKLTLDMLGLGYRVEEGSDPHLSGPIKNI